MQQDDPARTFRQLRDAAAQSDATRDLARVYARQAADISLRNLDEALARAMRRFAKPKEEEGK